MEKIKMWIVFECMPFILYVGGVYISWLKLINVIVYVNTSSHCVIGFDCV